MAKRKARSVWIRFSLGENEYFVCRDGVLPRHYTSQAEARKRGWARFIEVLPKKRKAVKRGRAK